MFWKGRNQLWWRNKVVFGRYITPVVITCILVNINSILFMIFPVPYFANKYTYSVFLLPFYLQVSTSGLLIITSAMDPGIIPRRIIQTHNSFVGADIFFRINHLWNDFKLKFWITCVIWRPPRVSHCSICDNWVMRWDHHCPWIGTWIGRRNYKYFFWFLFHLFTYSFLILIISLVHLFLIVNEYHSKESLSYTSDWVNALKESPISLILWVLNTPTVAFVGSLLFFQIYLWLWDMTSNEYMKEYFKGFPYTPYSTGSIWK